MGTRYPPRGPGPNVGPAKPFEEFKKDEIEQSIPHRFEQQVARYPELLAAKGESSQFTYRQLNAAANRISHAIMARRAAGEEPVGILLDNDALAVAAILGVLKAGKAFVPLDPSLPQDRLGYFVADSTADLIVTDTAHAPQAESLTRSEPSLLIVDDMDAGLSSRDPKLPLSPDTIAYIYYTSGTSGRPKGVYNSHRNLLHHILRVTNPYRLWAGDRLACVRSISFAAALKDIFGAVLNGASVWFFSLQERGFDQMACWLAEEEITVYVSVATTFRRLAAAAGPTMSFPALRIIHIGGELVYWSDLDLYKRHFPPTCLFFLGFGITETGNVTHLPMNEATPPAGKDVPAGYPLPDMEVLILDDAGQQMAPDQVGQIAVRSPYVALGYWRQPELTRTRFPPDPAGSSARIYLTGDLGYVRPDGCLVCLGRADNQVKVAGHRIEPVEIEQALLAHAHIKEAVVTAFQSPSGAMQLVAYLVPAGQRVLTVSELRRFLAMRLPAQMIPSRFIHLDQMPLTQHGKLDRRALPAPDQSHSQVAAVFAGARNPIEEKLVAIWEQVLDREQVGIHDSFFELGGDSLTATRVLSRLRDAFQVQIPLRRIFETPTIAELADAIEKARNP